MRHGNKWTINELIALQREYELLEWSVQQIAEKHRRSVKAILCKLEAEGFITTCDEARGFDLSNSCDTTSYANSSDTSDMSKTSDSIETFHGENVVNDKTYNGCLNACEVVNDPISNLTERVWNLETNVNEIGSMMKQLFEVMVAKKTAKKNALRKY